MSLRPIYGGALAPTKPCPPITPQNGIVIEFIQRTKNTLNTLNITYDREFAVSSLNGIKNNIQTEIIRLQTK
jgi:hypothetical protein